jgi:ABC-2 type transport system ATP-binding protein
VIIMNDGRIIADDTVENLTGVFSSQAYEVTMNGTLPERSRRTIEREHTVERWEQTADGATQFEVVLEDGAALYDLVGTLEASGIAVASLDAIQPDLESAFLEITNDDRASRAGDEETAGDSTADTESEVSAPMPEPDGGLGADDSGQETGGDRS